MKTVCLYASLLILSTVSTPNHAQQTELLVRNALVAEAPPNSRVAAAYFEIHNPSTQAITLLKIVSPQFEGSEIHETVLNNGMARMKSIPHLRLKPNQRTVFQPGGLHLMLMNPRAPLKAGDIVLLNFHCSNGKVINVTTQVRRLEDTGHHHHH